MAQRDGDVVAVSDVRHLAVLEAAEALPDGEQVGQDLAGVLDLGQGVDDRNAGEPGQLAEVGVMTQPGHHQMHVTFEDAGRVRHRLAHAYLNVLLAERDRCSAQPRDPHLEGDPGPVRWLLEEHGHELARQGPLLPATRFDLAGQVQNGEELRSIEVGNAQEVASPERHRGIHPWNASGPCRTPHPPSSLPPARGGRQAPPG